MDAGKILDTLALMRPIDKLLDTLAILAAIGLLFIAHS